MSVYGIPCGDYAGVKSNAVEVARLLGTATASVFNRLCVGGYSFRDARKSATINVDPPMKITSLSPASSDAAE